ncbi:MAG: serine protease [Flavobacteriaceae bacterium]|nr:serine protease [Flavobacteriaceae bacterium]
MKQIFLIIILFFNIHLLEAQKRIELNTALMNSTFKIKGLNGSYGTAFILEKPVNSETKKKQFVLITADHVLREMKGDSAILFLRWKINNTEYKKLNYKIKIRDNGEQSWVNHDSADVAALYVTLPKNIHFKFLNIGMIGTDKLYEKINIHPGDQFLCLGFPLGQESNKYGFPIVRRGILSSYPITPGKQVGNYLLDIKIFKGNSGGPVYFVQSGRTYRGEMHIETTQFIAGLISKERVKITQIKSAYKTSVEAQQLDLAEVVPGVFIIETIAKLQ